MEALIIFKIIQAVAGDNDLLCTETRGMFKGFHALKNIADYLKISIDAYGKIFLYALAFIIILQ